MIYSYLKDITFTAVKGMQSSKLGMPKRYHCQWNSYKTGTFSVFLTVILKLGKGLEFGAISYLELFDVDRVLQDILEVARFKGFSPIVKTLDDAVQEELKDLTNENIKVMDAGAGTGLVGVELHKFGFTTIDALDISPGMLEEAKKKNVYRKFICAALSDQRILEIETGEYDVLICVGVFAIAHVPPVAIMELIRMVKAGGVFYTSD